MGHHATTPNYFCWNIQFLYFNLGELEKIFIIFLAHILNPQINPFGIDISTLALVQRNY